MPSTTSSRRRVAARSLAALAPLVFVGSVNAEDVLYTYQLWDPSPVLQYLGDSTSDPNQGWNQSYSGSPVGSYVAGQSLGQNVSTHTTTYSGGKMFITTVAQNVYFRGLGEGKIDVILDEDSLQPARGSVTLNQKTQADPAEPPLLGQVSSTVFANHKFSLQFVETGYGFVSIERVDVDVVVGGAGSSNTSTTDNYIIDPSSSAIFSNVTTAGGAWGVSTETCDGTVNCRDDPKEATYAWTNVQGATLQFDAPANAAFVALHGPVGADFGQYSVSLDPAPYAGDNPYKNTPKTRYNDLDQCMYLMSLDPKVQYKITLKNEGTNKVGLGRAHFLLHQTGEYGSNSDKAAMSGGVKGDNNNNNNNAGSSSSKTSSTAAIAGGVVGGLAALAAIGAIIFFCLRRRRRGNKGDNSSEKTGGNHGSRFEIEGGSDIGGSSTPMLATDYNDRNHTITPYNVPAQISAPLPNNNNNNSYPSPYPESSYGGTSYAGDNSYPPAPVSAGALAGMNKGQREQLATQQYHGYSESGMSTSPPPSSVAPLMHGAMSSGAPSEFGRPDSAALYGSSSVQTSLSAFIAHDNTPSAVNEEQDAGRVYAPDESVPPRYNPEWANEGRRPPAPSGSSPLNPSSQTTQHGFPADTKPPLPPGAGPAHQG